MRKKRKKNSKKKKKTAQRFTVECTVQCMVKHWAVLVYVIIII